MQGTLQVSDTLATLAAMDQGTTAALYGVDQAFAVIDQDNRIYNEQVKGELIPDFCTISAEREWVYGGNDEMTVEEIDEYGDPDVEKVATGDTMGAPLRKIGRSLGWTWNYAQVVPVAELAKQYTAVQTADLKGIRRNIRNAFFNPTNNLTYRDKLIDGKQIPYYALLNGDGMNIPLGTNAAVPDAANRNHYIATNAPTAATIKTLINKVLAFDIVGELIVYIPLTFEDTMRSYNQPGQFTELKDVQIVQANTTTYVQGALEMFDVSSRRIGKFGAAWVEVRPWVPDNYILVVDKGSGMMKPLQFRTRPNGTFSDFGPRYKSQVAQLYADSWARDYGVAVRNRHMAAALYVGGNTYVAPTS